MNAPTEFPITVVKGTCPHDCPDTCALHVSVQNGRAIKVEGDPNHPTTAGVLCTKVSRYTERTYHKDRLTTPLKRVGPKGSRKFVAVSWDEAIDDIARKLKAIHAANPEAILPYSYAGTMGFVQGESLAARFFHRLGASRLDRTICSSAGMAGLKYTLGASVGMDVEQFKNAKLIILWGTNPITSSVHLWGQVQEAKRNGARIIAIDPFSSDSAQKCHQHIAIKPGTDAALALSMMQVLIAEDLLDRDYIEKYTHGFEALCERAAQYTPLIAAKICGIEPQVIVDLAREYAGTRASAIRLNYGMQRARGGANAVRAVLCLPALTGAWREPAGGALLSTSSWYPVNNQALQRPDLCPNYPALPRLLNMSNIGDHLLNGDSIQAVVVYNSNPVAIAPDSEKVIAGFAREDLFTVVLEHFQTDTADYADYVLPATTQLEHFDVHKSYGHWYVMANHPAIAPVGQAKPNSEIFRLLARAMGWNEAEHFDSDQTLGAQVFDWSHPRLRHSSYAQLLNAGWVHLGIDKTTNPFAQGGFPTASGRCEFYSQALADQGHDPLPDYLEPYEQACEEFPLQMISPPARNFLNTSFVNVDSLRKNEPQPRAVLHPTDAAQRGIERGAAVRLFNARGSCELVADVSGRTRAGLVVVPSIWWHKMAKGGRNVNALTNQRLTDLGGGPTFYDCAVQIEAI